ncbi:CARDB domain-containing protein [Vandammella animalimorsus]|nr:CARDB domain-containing protein [Vandammella animalimorsus]
MTHTNSPRPGRLWRLSATAAALWLAVALPQAQAAVKELAVAVASDGTAGWDQPAQDGTPGYDSGPSNGRVRTNDEVHYRVAISTDPQPDNDVTIVSALPAGGFAEWLALPSQCTGAGSVISPDKQTLTCVLPGIAASTTENVILRAFVRGSATQNGDVLQAPTTTLTSAAVTAPLQPVSNANSVNITAAPFYDAVVQMSFQGNPSAYGFYTQNGPSNEDGAYHRPMVGLRAAHPAGWGRKGVERLQGDVTINVDVSGYPAGTQLDNWHGSGSGAHGGASGSFVNSACGSPNNGWPSHESGSSINLFQRVGDAGAAYSGSEPFIVPNGGTCAVAASGGQLAVTISGIDTNLEKRPTQQRGGYDISSDPAWWVSNKALVLWTPLDSYTPNVATPHTVKLLNYQGTSVSGQPISAVSGVSNNTTNDEDSYSMTRQVDGSMSKVYAPDTRPGAPYGTARDPGESGDHKVNYMAAGQVVAARLTIANKNAEPLTGISACEVIDRTAFDLSMGAELVTGAGFEAQIQGVSGPGVRIRYGKRSNGSRYFASTDSSSGPLDNGTPGNSEYGGGGGLPNTLHHCADSNPNIQWFDNLSDVGEDLVYVRADIAELPAGRTAYLFVRGLKLRKTWANTINVIGGSQTGTTRQADTNIAAGSLIRNRATGRADNFNFANYSYRDHLVVVPSLTYSRVTKAVKGHTDVNNLPVISAGNQVRYVLQPRFSTQMPQIPAQYVVTDILPPNLSYVPGSATVAGVAVEPVVQADTPAAGFTTLTWNLGTKTPFLGEDTSDGAKLETIEFAAQVAVNAQANSTLRNHSAVSGGANDDHADCAFSSTAPIGYGNCVKAAHTDILVQVPARVSLSKTLQGTTGDIQPGQNFQYSIAYSSDLPVAAEDVPDLIDILPYAGDGASDPSRSFTGRSPATVMQPGAYRLTQVDVANGETVYYTNRAPGEIHNNPRDSSNAIPGGATKWCLSSDFGTAGCPSDIGAATAVRINPPSGMTMAAGQQYPVLMHFATNPAIAKQGDIYNNSVGAQSPEASASGLQFIYASADKGVRIQGGVNSLTGKVYVDRNDDGQVDAGDDGIQGNKLVLYACSVGPNGTVDTIDMGSAVPPSCAGDDILVTYPETLTNADGEYQFTGLQNGLYKVVQPDQPAGYYDGKTTPGTGPAAAGVATVQGTTPSAITNILLNGGVSAVNYNFGELLPTIEAHGDDLGRYNAATGGVTPSVLGNNGSGADKADGADATLANVTLTQLLASNPGVALNPATGQIEVIAGAPVGAATVEYEICLVSHPTVCAKATETVHVVSIDAVDDNMGEHNFSASNPITTPSVLADNNGNGGDKANDQPAVIGTNVTLMPGTPSNAALTMDAATGVITVAAGTAPGTYTYPYTICLHPATNPATCDTATATVVVKGVIAAVDDNMGEHNYSATNPIVTPSVVADNGSGVDTANGQPAVIGTNVTLTPGTPSNPALTMNATTGVITVAAGTSPGTYTYPYTICLHPATNPAICATATATVVVKDAAEVSLTKEVDKADASVGDEVTFTITVINNGPSAAQAVSVSEQLPSGYTLVSATPSVGAWNAPTWTVGNLAEAAVETLTVKATVNATGDYVNTATVSSTTTPGDDPSNNSDTATVTPKAKADVRLSKTVDKTDASVGDEVTFTITVTNDGPSTAQAVTVNEQLPSGYTLVSATPGVGNYTAPTWTVGDLANAASATLTVKATVNATGDYVNTATVSSTTTPGDDPSNNSGTATVTAKATVKAVDDDMGTIPSTGGKTPSVVADNNGNGGDKANGLPAVIDTNVTLTPGALPNPPATGGLEMNPDGTITVKPGTPAGTYEYPYEICLLPATTPATCDTATATVKVAPTIQAVDDDMGTIPSTGGKTPSVVADNKGNGGDKANGLPAVIGTNVTLTPGALPNPPATGGLEMNPDGTITVKPGTPAGTYEYPYEICLLPATTPATCSNAVATVKVNDVKVDLQVSKSVDKLTPNVGETVRFTLEVKNLGPADATGVKVVDQLPSGYEFVAAQSPAYDAATGVWTLGNLANGASASLWIDAKVKPAGEYRNTATVDSDQSDVVQSNNSSSVQPAPVGAPSASPVPVPANAPWALWLMALAVLMLARQGRLGRR